MIKEYVPKIKKIQKVLNYIIIFELVFFTAFVGYEFLNWKKKMDTLTKLTKEVSEKSELFTNLGNMEKDINIMIEEMENEKMVFFNRENYEEFVGSLEKKIKEFGLSLKSIYIGEKSKLTQSGYFKIPLKIEVQGKVENLIKFLSFIEKYRHSIAVKSEFFSLYGENLVYTLNLSLDIPLYEEISVP